jgi:hypothetical protein
VGNRLSVVDVASGATRIVDLDALAPPGAGCAQPAAVAFTSDGQRVFVAAYGSDRVAVLDLDPQGQAHWAGHFEVRAGRPYPGGSGPRGLLVSPDGSHLYVFAKLDNAVVEIPLHALAGQSPFVGLAPKPVSTGFSPVIPRMHFGQTLFARASFSGSGLSSCASCHPDGGDDGLAWDLSVFLDPEETPPDSLQFGVDVKGPLVTQPCRGLGETAPYHWRGEKRRLTDFNQTFADLLQHQRGGEPATIGPDFQYLAEYMQLLAIPANPRQQLDRSLTAAQTRGEVVFREAPSFRGHTCADCHALPLGTTGERVAFKVGGASKSGVVPQLRGVADKLATPFAIGGAFGKRTELGAGLLHGGAVPSLLAMLQLRDPDHPGQALFDLSPSQANDLVAFLEAFDTGLAPATTLQVTARPENAMGEALEMLELLMAQAQAGHCDLIARRVPEGTPPALFSRSLLYLPAKGLFQPASRTAAGIAPGELLREAAAGSPVTFLGLPLQTGLQMALDRDLDELWDQDERAAGTDPENFDSDRDGFPDGYEIAWGMNPLVADSHSPDHEPPMLLGSPRVGLRTQTALGLDFETDEPARAILRREGQLLVRLPRGQGYEREFTVVLSELEAGSAFLLELELIDPSGNRRTELIPCETLPARFPEPVHVAALRPTLVDSRLELAVQLAQGLSSPPPGYRARVSLYHRRHADGALTLVTTAMDELVSDNASRLLLAADLPSPAQLGGSGVLIATVQEVSGPPGAPAHVLALDRVRQIEIEW